MKITIYQIIPELDQDRLMFMPLSYFQKAGYPSPPAEIYESVFCGETEVATLEKIYRIFNRLPGEGRVICTAERISGASCCPSV